MTRDGAAGLGAAELGLGPGRARAGVDRRRRLAGPARRAVRSRRPRSAPSGSRILGVSEVTRAIRGAVRADPRLADLWVEGEIGRVTVSSAGHAYFALKDERNQLQCVWFRDDRLRRRSRPRPGCGSSPTAGSTCSSRRARSSCTSIRSSRPGLGDLTLRFEALKARLAGGGPVRRRRASGALPDRPADDRRRHQPERRRLEGHLPRPRAALAAQPGRPGRRPGPGRRRAGQPASAALRKVERYAAERDGRRSSRRRRRR